MAFMKIVTLDRLVMNIELRMKFPGKSYDKIARKIDKIMYARLLKIQAQEWELLSRIWGVDSGFEISFINWYAEHTHHTNLLTFEDKLYLPGIES